MAANTFLRLNMLFIADSHTGFCSGLLWKHELNFKSSHWSCSVKRVSLEHLLISGTRLCWSLFLIELQTFHRSFLVKLIWFYLHLIWSLQTTASETCSFTWTALFNNLWLCLLILPSLLLILLQSTVRSSPPVVLCEKGVLTDFANLTRKHLL